jgi:hypothetical protein
VPLPAPLLDALQSVEVTHSDEGRSGFQMVFSIGRGPSDLLDFPLVSGILRIPFLRVLIMITFSGMPKVLMDGIVTNQQFNPGNQPGTSTFTLTGEDVSVMMDREEKSEEHPGQHEAVIVLKIIASYAQYGLIPVVIPPFILDIPLPIERIPVQQGTDLAYIQEMAQRYNYVFYVTPGPVPGTNKAYWGPSIRVGIPQRALTYNMGPNSNVETLDFQYNPLDPAQVTGQVQDRSTNQSMPVRTFASTRPPLASIPASLLTMRKTVLRESGTNTGQAMAHAQAATDASMDQVVTVTGELNSLHYGGILEARGLVGLRGAGFSYDGIYYVKSVTYTSDRSTSKQRFTLTREGLGSTTPIVRA